jgi:hypothetical protein
MPPTTFEQTFQILKRRVLTVGSASGAFWGGCATIGLLLVSMWLDLIWDLSGAARVIGFLAALVAGLTLLVVSAAAALRRVQATALARQLDETAGLGGEIVAGFELQAANGTDPSTNGLTSALAQLAVRKAAQLASEVPVEQAASSRPVRRAAVGFGALSLGVVLIALFAPRLAGTEWRRFADPFGDHPPYSRTELQIEPGNAQVRYGDGLDVFVTASGPPVDELELVLRHGDSHSVDHEESLPMFPDTPGRWRASIASVTTDGQYFVRARTTRSYRYDIDVITVPALEDVRFRVISPEYTRESPFEGPLPPEGLSALAGSTVEVRAKSNRPLKAGTLDLVSGEHRETITLNPAASAGDSHEVSGSWVISRPGTFQLKVTDVDGQDSRDTLGGTITVLKDQVPFVRLIEPIAQSLATPSITLPVVVSAEDDYGITRLQLYRSLNDSRPVPQSLEIPTPPVRRLELSTSLALSTYGLRPGDVIKLFARVEDNDPAGAKGSESPVAVIQIISDEELERMIRTREGVDMLYSKYQAAQRRMEAMQEELEKLQKQLEKRDAEGSLSPEEQEQLETLAKQIEEEAKAIRESAKHVMPYDIDQSLNDELEKLAKSLDEAAKTTRESATRPEGSPKAGETAQALKAAREKLADEIQEFQKGVNEPLDRLAKIYPLLEDQSRFVELYHRQRDLAERLASLDGIDNPEDPAIKSRMRELEEEQRKNHEDLESLLNDIAEHAALIPDDDPELQELAATATEFVENVLSSEAIPAMNDAQTGLAEFSGARGHQGAKSAADHLQQFLSKCEGMGEQAEGACQGLKFSPGEGCLGDSLNQMLSDAGFKPKNGQSGQMGAGGGFSSRKSSLRNMGLYGQMPTRGNPTQSKSGNGKQSLSVGGSYRADDSQVTNSRLDPHGQLKASGTSEAAVPTRYRNRVEQYFRRIADEAGK